MSYSLGSIKPDENASNEEKLGYKYGLAYAKYIDQNHWLNSGWMDSQENYIENELYRSGTQSNYNVKKYLLNGKNKSFGKLNFTPVNIIPEFVKVIKENLNLHLFESKCTAIDRTSVDQRKKEKDGLISKMINGQFNQNMTDVTGIDFNDKGFIPNSDKEIDVFMETESTLPQEIAIEQAITGVKEANYYDDLKDRVADDSITYGRLVFKDDYDPQLGVRIKRVAPPNYVTSYDGSELNDNRGAFYDGHIEMVALNDLRRIGLVEQSIVDYANNLGSATRQEYIQKRANRYKWDDLASTMVKVLFFEFRTNFSDTYRKKTRKNGKISVDIADPEFNFNKGNVETLHDVKEVWIEGAWIVDTEIILNYGKRTNMVFDSLKKVRSSYSSYDTNEMSLVRKMISHADDMNLALVKMRQAIAESKSAGLAINISALLDIPNASGDGTVGYLDVIRRYEESGNILYRDDEFSAGQGLPIKEIMNGLSDDVFKYQATYNFHLQQINIITGVNNVMSGQGAETRVSTESNQIALQHSIKAIEFIKRAVLSCEKRLSENIMLRILDIDKYDKPFKKYIQALGVFTMDALNNLDKLHPFSFSLRIIMLPNNEERQEQSEDLTLAFQAGDITVSDKIAVRNITNLKLAESNLDRRIKSNMEAKRAHEIKLAQSSKDGEILKIQEDREKATEQLEHDKELAYQAYIYEKDLLGMKLGSAENIQNQKAIQGFNSEMRGVRAKNDTTLFQEGKKDERQTKQLQALKENKLQGDAKKNLSKPKK